MNMLGDIRTIIGGVWGLPAWQGKIAIINLVIIMLVTLAFAPVIGIIALLMIGGFVASETRQPHVRERIERARANGRR